MRRVRGAVVVVTAGLALLAPGAAQAASRLCPSGDLRYAFAPGQPKRFGVFALRAGPGTSCATARQAVRRWAGLYEHTGVPPRRAGGFTFTALRATHPQELRRRGRRGRRRISFTYRVVGG